MDTARTDTEQRFRHFVPLLAAALTLTAVLIDGGTASQNLVALTAVIPMAAWAWWRWPPLALVVPVAAVNLYVQTDGRLEPMLFLLSIAALVVGGWERSRAVSLAALGIAVATPAVVELLNHDGILVPVWIAGILMPYFLGRAYRSQVELSFELDAARRELADMAVLDERRRIARDVHDLVGHGLAAVMLQVTGARHVLRRDPDAADEALASAEDIGKRSLQELRGTLSLMRSVGEAGGPGPVPGAADIADAVDRVRDTGLTTSFRADGDLSRIDPAVGLSLHRVVEEALANAQRHAPEAATDVKLVVGEDVVDLLVETVGPGRDDGADDDPGRPRYGLIGMQERMAAVGGRLDAGPTPLGWRVRCRAPLSMEDVGRGQP